MREAYEELNPARTGSRVLAQSPLGKAVRYMLSDSAALQGYLADGRLEIDNNLIENAIRPSYVGKKNWLFIGHPEAGWRSAVIYILIVSSKRHGYDPVESLPQPHRISLTSSPQTRNLSQFNLRRIINTILPQLSSPPHQGLHRALRGRDGATLILRSIFRGSLKPKSDNWSPGNSNQKNRSTHFSPMFTAVP